MTTDDNVVFLIGCYEAEAFNSHTNSWDSPPTTLPFTDLRNEQHFASLSEVERKVDRAISSRNKLSKPQWSNKWDQGPWEYSTDFGQPFSFEPNLSDTVRRRKWTQLISIPKPRDVTHFRLLVSSMYSGLVEHVKGEGGELLIVEESTDPCLVDDEEDDRMLSRERFSVRGIWQDSSSVLSCTSCNANFFGVGSKKVHCVGCGLVFCTKCCRKESTVAMRRVCNSCLSNELLRTRDSLSARSSCSAFSESPSSRRGSTLAVESSLSPPSAESASPPCAVVGSFQDVIYENERFFPGVGWGVHRLPTDIPRFSDELGTIERNFEAADADVEKQNGEWQGEWEIDVVIRRTDSEGWMYGWHFETPVNELHRRQKMAHLIRRRRWRRSANILSGASARHSTSTACRATLQIYQTQRLRPAIGWSGSGLPQGRPEYSDRDGTVEAKILDVEHEIRSSHPSCRLMLQQWIVDKDEHTSDEGWIFSPEWELDPAKWSRSMRRGDIYRRRIWTNIVDAPSSAVLLSWSSKLKLLLSGTEAADAIAASAASQNSMSPHDGDMNNNNPTPPARSVQVKFVVFENERKYPFAGFTTKRLPTDRPHFSNSAGTMEREKSQVDSELPLDAFLWEDDAWSVVVNDTTDMDGWSYAVNYCFEFSSERRPRHCVRSRAWSRIAKPIDESLSIQKSLPPRLLAIATVFDTCAETSAESETQGSSADAPASSAKHREIIYYRTAYESGSICGTCFESFNSDEKQKRHCRSCGRLHCSLCCKVEAVANFSRVCRGCLQIIVERQVAADQAVDEPLEVAAPEESSPPSVAPSSDPQDEKRISLGTVGGSVVVQKEPSQKSCCSIS